MEEKIYVVTLYNHEDLEQFYDEMDAKGYPIEMKRPMSRNTHYKLTEEQAEELRLDPRVWDIQPEESFVIASHALPVNNTPYEKNGTFSKTTSSTSTDFQWGHLHCNGSTAQRRKGQWGIDLTSDKWKVNDSTTIFNDGMHVDVVIVDDSVSYDCDEWKSPSTGSTRFVQYQWFTNLNTYVATIDDDFQSRPTGNIVYHSNSTNPNFHGNHVAGTVAGQYYGWAREANIYNLAVTSTWSSGQIVGGLLIFDYLRAFHRHKGINPVTGKKNPTVTNHSYGGIVSNSQNLQFANLSSLVYRGVTYRSTNPGPSGWNQAGVEADFGVRFGGDYYPSWSAAIAADVQDAVKEGIVIIGSSGNLNLFVANGTSDIDWNNYITVIGVGSIFYNRGSWPNSPDSGSISVGALGRNSDFRRASFSNFGPGVDIWAPGEAILSAYNNTGTADTKYGGANYFQAISGTSMASPQVTGIAAVLASGKGRFTNEDVLKYLKESSTYDDMTFDSNGGSFSDVTCSKGSLNAYLSCKNPRKTSGQIAEVKGQRKSSGQLYPRTNTFYQSQ